MGVNRVKKRGKVRIEVRKRWPDGTTFRRYYPNMTVAKQDHVRIEESIITGKWPALKQDLSGYRKDTELTVGGFADIYLNDYCRIRNRDVAFKERAIREIVKVVGDVPLSAFGRRHAHEFAAIRGRQVSPASVNRNLAVLKNLFTFALEREYIAVHPLSRFRLLERREIRDSCAIA